MKFYNPHAGKGFRWFIMGCALGFLGGGLVIIRNHTLWLWFNNIDEWLRLKLLQGKIIMALTSPLEMLWALSCLAIIIWFIYSIAVIKR